MGAGQLAAIDGPLANDTITFYYDELGRTTNQSIKGVGANVTYDAIGRATFITNALGTFTNTYVNATARPSSIAYPNGQTCSFGYYDVNNDQRLQTLWNRDSGGNTLSKFDYTYDAEGQIQTWTRQAGTLWTNTYTFTGDRIDQLLDATLRDSGATALVKQFVYGYDAAGNRINEQIDMSASRATHNSLNQLTSRSGSGQIRFRGALSEPGTATVGGQAAAMTTPTNLNAKVSLLVGTNLVPVVATDYSGNSRTNNYTLVVTNNQVAETLVYDLNGNLSSLTTATSTNTYLWDAANRLVQLLQACSGNPSLTSQFSYDGLGRRVKTVESTNGLPGATNVFVWCGTELCEQRDATGTAVTRRFFGQGEKILGTNYYFTTDHLGSIREMTDSSGAVRARYDYDPYGRRTRVSGDIDPDFAFTGLYYHAPSGLYVALFRVYSSDLGRWLSRDPIGELGGINLYAYVLGNTINLFDAFGLSAWSCFAKGFALGVIASAVAYTAASALVIGGVMSAPAMVGTLVVLGGIGAVSSLLRMKNDHSMANVAYNVGGVLGGAAFGARVRLPLRNLLSSDDKKPDMSGKSLFGELMHDIGNVWRKGGRTGPIAPWRYAMPSEFVQANKSGPDTASATGTLGAIGCLMPGVISTVQVTRAQSRGQGCR